tara:strand:- start:39666 stop:40262 length:597 start_codon:yes stop_codon:yes gene_type:complete
MLQMFFLTYQLLRDSFSKGTAQLFTFLILGNCSVVAQAWNTARLSFVSPSNIEVSANSFDEINDGITIPAGLIIGVTISDLNDVGASGPLTGFSLSFRTANGVATEMEGVNGNSIDINTVALTASNEIGLGLSSFLPPVLLSSFSQTLMSSNTFPCDWRTHQVAIQFEFGTVNCTGKLYDQATDYYTVEIEYTLEPTF